MIKNKKKLLAAINKILSKSGADGMIEVSVSSGITANTGNYESLRFNLGLSAKCKMEYADEVREAFQNYIDAVCKDKYEEHSITITPKTDVKVDTEVLEKDLDKDIEAEIEI